MRLFVWFVVGVSWFTSAATGRAASSGVPLAVWRGDIPPGVTISQVAANSNLSMALGSDGRLYTWGLGVGSVHFTGYTVNNLATNTTVVPVLASPGAIPAGASITAIQAGGSHGLVLDETGQVYAAGSNIFGELGHAEAGHSRDYKAVLRGAIPAGVTITAIAAGNNYSLALGSDGLVYAWGNGLQGQLGHGLYANASLPVAVSPGAIPAGVQVVAISARGSRSFALGSDGRVYYWGGYSETPPAPTVNVPTVLPTGAIPAGVRIQSISVGKYHVLLLGDDGVAYVAGRSGTNQPLWSLPGDGVPTPNTQDIPPQPIQRGAIPPGVGIAAIAAGDGYSTLLGTDGKVYAWGLGHEGRLGNGRLDDSAQNSPAPVEAGAIPPGVTIRSLSTGDVHAAAIGSDGWVYTWGADAWSVLGTGAPTPTLDAAVTTPNFFEYLNASVPVEIIASWAMVSQENPEVGVDPSDFTVTGGVIESFSNHTAHAVLLWIRPQGPTRRVTLHFVPGSAARAMNGLPFGAMEPLVINWNAPSSFWSPVGASTTRVSIPLTLTLGHANNGLTPSDLAVSNATIQSIGVQGDDYVLTVVPHGEGSVSVTLPAALAGGTALTWSTVLDRTAPVLSAAVRDPAIPQAPGSVVWARVTATEPLVNFRATNLRLSGATLAGFSVETDRTYLVGLMPDVGVSRALLSFVLAGAWDQAGNPAIGNPVELSWLLPPLGVTLTSDLGSATNQDLLPITVRFDRPILNLTAADLVTGNATVVAITGSGTDYVLTLAPLADGPVSLTFTDALAAGAVLTPWTTRSDRTRPEVAFALVNPAELDGPTSRVEVVLTASEPLVGLDQEDLILNGAVLERFEQIDASTARLVVAPSPESLSATVSLNLAGTRDAAGNLPTVEPLTIDWPARFAPTGQVVTAVVYLPSPCTRGAC